MRAPWIFWGRGQAADYQPLHRAWQFPGWTQSPEPYVIPWETATFTVWLDQSMPMNPFPDVPLSCRYQDGWLYHTQGTSLIPGTGMPGRSLFTGLYRGLFTRVN